MPHLAHSASDGTNASRADPSSCLDPAPPTGCLSPSPPSVPRDMSWLSSFRLASIASSFNRGAPDRATQAPDYDTSGGEVREVEPPTLGHVEIIEPDALPATTKGQSTTLNSSSDLIDDPLTVDAAKSDLSHKGKVVLAAGGPAPAHSRLGVASKGKPGRGEEPNQTSTKVQTGGRSSAASWRHAASPPHPRKQVSPCPSRPAMIGNNACQVKQDAGDLACSDYGHPARTHLSAVPAVVSPWNSMKAPPPVPWYHVWPSIVEYCRMRCLLQRRRC